MSLRCQVIFALVCVLLTCSTFSIRVSASTKRVSPINRVASASYLSILSGAVSVASNPSPSPPAPLSHPVRSRRSRTEKLHATEILRSTALSQPSLTPIVPSAIWAGVVPDQLTSDCHSGDGELYIISDQVDIDDVLRVDVHDGSILSRYALHGRTNSTFYSYFGVEVRRRSNSSTPQLFVGAVRWDDDHYSGNVVLQREVTNDPTAPTSITKLPNDSDWFSVDQSGEVILTGGSTPSTVVKVNSTTGEVTATLNGGSGHLSVRTAVLHPTNGNVLLVNGSHTNWSVLCIDSTNRIVWRTLIEQPHPDIGDLTIDEKGEFLYVQWQDFNKTSELYVITQYEVASGKLIRNGIVPTDGNGMFEEITVACDSASVWFTQLASRRLARLQLDSGELHYIQIGDIPLLYLPVSVAVLPDQAGVLVAQVGLGVGWGSYSQVIQLDVRGRRVRDVPPALGICASSAGVPFQFVAVDASSRRVCVTQCNDTILVYDIDLTQQFSVALPKSQPRACYPAANDTMYITERSANRVLRVDLHTGAVVSTLQGEGNTEFCGLSVDIRDGSVWVANTLGSVVHFASNGTLLSEWHFGNEDERHAIYFLTVDLLHSRVIVTEDMTLRGIIPGTSSHILWLDIETGAVVGNYTYGPVSAGVAVSEDGRIVYAAQCLADEVLLFTQDNSIINEMNMALYARRNLMQLEQ